MRTSTATHPATADEGNMNFAEIKELIFRYVGHKAQLAKHDKFGYYNQITRRIALGKLQNLNKWLMNNIVGQRQAIAFILQNEMCFYNVLPHEGNSSYESQVRTYLTIIQACRDLASVKPN
jgi:capsule polysaccharide export protein KpsC/LpsZ